MSSLSPSSANSLRLPPSWNFVTNDNPASTITFQRRTPEEDAISRLYNVVIYGQKMLVTYTRSVDAVTEWIESVKTTEVRHVGFEVELEFEDTHIGTLQLYLPRNGKCLVFQPFFIPDSLAQFLGDPNNQFVGTNMRDKTSMLREQFPFKGEPVNFKDMCRNVPELKDEKKRLLGMISPWELGTEWGRPSTLSDDQVHYACLDAYLSFQMSNHLWSFT